MFSISRILLLVALAGLGLGLVWPDPAWAQVQNYVLTLGERPERQHSIIRGDGTDLVIRLVPVAGGATVISFGEPPGADAPLRREPATTVLALPDHA